MSPRRARPRRAEVDIRPTTKADLPELLSLWSDGRVMRWVGFPNGLGYDEAKLQNWFERLEANPRRHHFIARAPAIGFCGELYYAVDPEHRCARLDIKFRPEAQGGGRSFAALSELIRRVFESESEVDAVWTQPSTMNLAARTLYWSCGLRETERPVDMESGIPYWELTRERWLALQGSPALVGSRLTPTDPSEGLPPTVEADSGIDVREESKEDRAGVLEVNRFAFGGPAEARLVDALRGRPDCLSFVACAGGSVVGHILFTPVRIDGPSAQVRAVGLGPMAVLPDRQRQGIGSRLVQVGLEECRRLGYEVVIVLGHASYYPRFGFRPAHLSGLRWEHPAPEEAFMVLELTPGILAGGGGIVSYLSEFGSV